MSWITPITDRTTTDIGARTSKAFFNIVDWVRVYGNSEQIHALSEALLLIDIDFTSLTAPTITQFPSADDINTLVENIDLVRESAALPAALAPSALDHTYLEGTSAAAPSFEDVNAWEKALETIFEPDRARIVIHALLWRFSGRAASVLSKPVPGGAHL